MAAAAEQEQAGLYCSTSGTYFTDKDSLAAHCKSDFHRQVAGCRAETLIVRLPQAQLCSIAMREAVALSSALNLCMTGAATAPPVL